MGITFPFLLDRLQTIGAFCLYAGFNVVAFIMIFLWVPETMQRSLEEMDAVFSVPVRKYAAYQLFTVAPWWIRKYLLFQRNAKKQPLYAFEKDYLTSKQDLAANQAIASIANEGIMPMEATPGHDHETVSRG